MRRLAAIFGAAVALSGAAWAQAELPDVALSGPARIYSSDAIVVGDNLVAFRLWAADAPEVGQPCWIEGKEWACADAALDALEALLAGKTVTCELRRDTHRTRRGRIYAVCVNSGGVDLARALVEAGLALAFAEQGPDYVASERKAEAARAGMWQGTFIAPWAFLDQLRTGN